jgi:hypothetical protein
MMLAAFSFLGFAVAFLMYLFTKDVHYFYMAVMIGLATLYLQAEETGED